MSVLVYTSVHGGYDPTVFELPSQTADEVTFARCADRPDRPQHPRLRARHDKCFPMPGYDVTIWVDGSIHVTSPRMVDDLLAVLGDRDIALFAHSTRTTIGQEAAAAAELGKYDGVDHDGLLEHLATGWGWPPERRGLYELGVIVRRSTPDVDRFNRTMWDLTDAWSTPTATVLDQLLVPAVLAACELAPAVIPGSIWTGGIGRWWDLHAHPADR